MKDTEVESLGPKVLEQIGRRSRTIIEGSGIRLFHRPDSEKFKRKKYELTEGETETLRRGQAAQLLLHSTDPRLGPLDFLLISPEEQTVAQVLKAVTTPLRTDPDKYVLCVELNPDHRLNFKQKYVLAQNEDCLGMFHLVEKDLVGNLELGKKTLTFGEIIRQSSKSNQLCTLTFVDREGVVDQGSGSVEQRDSLNGIMELAASRLGWTSYNSDRPDQYYWLLCLNEDHTVPLSKEAREAFAKDLENSPQLSLCVIDKRASAKKA